MKSYATPEMLSLLKEAVNIGAHGEMWHHAHMLWAQSIGLQGHKRLNRYEAAHDRAQYICIQNYSLDMFGEIITPDWNYTVTAPADLPGYLEGYVDWENSVYTRLGAISAQLSAGGFICEAELVNNGLPRKELEQARRMLTEYALSGWDMTYILEADKRLHDKIKAKEE